MTSLRPSDNPAQKTVTSHRRLLGPDISRGSMLLLIVAAYATVYAGASFGTDVAHLPLIDRVTTVASTIFLDNRAFSLFAILFGYWVARGVHRRREAGETPGQTYVRLVRRSWGFLLVGAVHAIVVFPGEILSAYGVALILVGWIALRSTKTTVVILVILFAVSVVTTTATALVNAFVMETGLQADAVVPGYLTTQDWLTRLGSYPISAASISLGYPLLMLVVLGFVAAREKIFEDIEYNRHTLRASAVLGIGFSVVAAIPSALNAVGVIDAGWIFSGLVNAVQVLSGIAGGIGYAALLALLGARLGRKPGAISFALAAMGSRSLTFYVANSVLVAVILHPDLIGVGAEVGPFGAILVAAGVWAAGLVAASFLERSGRRGALEVMMNRLVNGSRRA